MAPTPVVLDSQLRFRCDSKLALNYLNKTGQRPIIVTRMEDATENDDGWVSRRQVLLSLGMVVVGVATDHTGMCGLLLAPEFLKESRQDASIPGMLPESWRSWASDA